MNLIKIYYVSLFLLTAGCTALPETEYRLPPKKNGDDPKFLNEFISFHSQESEKLYSEAEINSQKSRKEKVSLLKKAYSLDSSNLLIWISLGRESGDMELLEKTKYILEGKNLKNNSVYIKLLSAFGIHCSMDAESRYNSEIYYIKAEEFFDKAVTLSEELNEKALLAEAFHFMAVNFRHYMQAYLPNRKIKERLPKLKKAVESLEKEYFLLQKTELASAASLNRKRSENLLELSLVYRDRWIYETGNPEEDIEDYKNRALKTVLKDYADHKISRIAAEKAYQYAEKNNYYDIMIKSLEVLSDSYYITDAFEEKNHTLPKGKNTGLTIANFRLNSSHTDRKKAAGYYIQAADLAEKKGDIKKSFQYRHQAAMIYSDETDPEEIKKMFTENLNMLEENYRLSPSSEILNQIYLIKTDMGISYMERFEKEEEILKYYTSFISDRRFTVPFFLNNHYHMQIYNNPRRRLAEYYAEKEKHCEALKWQTEYASFLLTFDPEDIRADLELKEYQSKCRS